MKNLLALILILFPAKSFTEAINNSNIVSYYNSIPVNEELAHSMLIATYKYKLVYDSNKWTTTGLYKKNKRIIPIIDDKNGYLKIYEDVESATVTSMTQEMAVFKTNHNEIYVAYNILCGQLFSDVDNFKFYLLKNNKFIDKSNILLKQIDNKRFFKNPNDYDKLIDIRDNNQFDPNLPYFKTRIKLPQIGTVVEVMCNTNAINSYIEMNKNFPEKAKTINKLKKLLNSIDKTILKYNWDMNKGTFYLIK